MRILIIRLSSIGDIILTFPLINLLKDKYPDCKIDYLVKKEYSELLQITKGINKIIPFDASKGIKEIFRVRSLIKNSYDHIIDLHNNQRSFLLTLFQSGIKYKFRKYSIRKFLLVKAKINFLKNHPPIWIRYIDSAKDLLGKDKINDKTCFSFRGEFPEPTAIFIKFPFLKDLESRITGFCPTAKHYTKRFPKEKFIELGKIILANFKSEIILFGSGDEYEYNETIKKELGDSCHNLSGKITFAETAIVLNYCDLVITNDTGLMHLANQMNIQMIACFGCTVKEFGFFPQGRNCHIFEIANLNCRPCSHIGRNNCPKKHFKCMDDIPIINIIDKSLEILNEKDTKKG